MMSNLDDQRRKRPGNRGRIDQIKNEMDEQVEPVSNCQRCHDTGLWQYDDVHAQPCPDCCPHDSGVWMLTFEYGDSGKWCCKAGCGTKWDGIIDYNNAVIRQYPPH
jgi:hypothetical protein